VTTRNSHISIVSECWIRRLTLFFLLFVCADIVFPPQCCEAMNSVAVRTTLSVSAFKIAAVGQSQDIGASDDCRPGTSPEEARCDEDCCFGCAHMLAPIAFSGVAVLDMTSSRGIMTDQTVGDPSLEGPDHPPRSI
jgi:hypothetical protein